MSTDDIISKLREGFARVPRPGIPPDYAAEGKLGNPGWDEFTYHSALVFAEQIPGHVRRALDDPEVRIPDLLWHLSDSERLGVFSNKQISLLLEALDVVEAAHPEVAATPEVKARERAVRETLERLLARAE